jgi:hypothetical protein
MGRYDDGRDFSNGNIRKSIERRREFGGSFNAFYGRPRPVRVFSVLLLLGRLQASIRSFRCL